ncbi:iron dicitrate transport regulator FecR [Flavobacterium aquidurense]|uniref:FecR family protein n=1 Tax=Flavobacterium aquidurense TaxID=362413 RepID=UPI0009200B12|nr:FecR family protein [Flavobacterium aquidurense]OXA74072.1 iron dicitrate transport regulator FecR [Flavobacterium aquidurense]SHG55923.1 FecR family protein [Flavobacterium frigidimaris]
MDEKKVEEELKKVWNETPVSHSDREKEISWEQFQAKAFSSKKKKSKAWIYYAAAAAVLIFAGTGLYFNGNPLKHDVQLAQTTIENTSSILKVVALPDSSRVELSPNSKITYANNFTVNRKVNIMGEAYFKVKKDKQHPFQVFCNETTTTVLGTSFTVKGYAQKEVTVELYEGSVQMNVKNQDKKWILKPGEKFTYGNLTASVAEFERFTDFENEKLIAVSAYIESNYGYKVNMPQEYYEQRITVRINKKEDLKTIVQLISEMYNLNFEVNEDLKQITFQ